MSRLKGSLFRGVDHPHFIHVSPTLYLMREPDYALQTAVHVGQIAEYLKFDE